MGIRRNAAQRRVGQFAKQFIVVDADDGHFIRHGGTDQTAGFQHLPSDNVEAGHDAHRFGKCLDPQGEAGHLIRPAVVGAMADIGTVHVGLSAGLSDTDLELFTAPFRPVVLVITAVREMFEAALFEMFKSECRDRDIVGFDNRDIGDERGGGEINRGQSGGADGFGDAGVFDAGDDAIPRPSGKPGGRGIPPPMLGEIGGPGAMLANVGDDAVQQSARVVVGGFDEERDGFSGSGHGGFRLSYLRRFRCEDAP